MGFRVSAEMLLIFKFPGILGWTSKRWISVVLFHFFYVAYFPHSAINSFIFTFDLKHKIHLIFFFRIHNFKRLLEKSSDSLIIEEFPFEVQIFLSSNLKGSYASVMD